MICLLKKVENAEIISQIFRVSKVCKQSSCKVSKNDKSCQFCCIQLKSTLVTSSLIWPSYTTRATIFEKVFQPEKFPKTEYFPIKRMISLSSRKFSSSLLPHQGHSKWEAVAWYGDMWISPYQPDTQLLYRWMPGNHQ